MPPRASKKAPSAKPRVPKIERAGHIAIVGRPNVGKSTLLNALLGEPIAITSHHPQTTRDRIAGIVTAEAGDGLAQCVFVDTPGLHRARTKLGALMNQEARESARDADVIVFMTDASPGMSDAMRGVDQSILKSLGEPSPRKPVILVLNKIDKIKAKHDLLPVLEGYAKAYDFAAIVPVSARKADGARGVLAEVAKLLPEGPALFPEDEVSDKPVRFFVAEFVREQILRRTRDEVPHGVAVVVERFDESPRVPTIDIAVHVDKDSHKAIVIGAKGQLLKEIGTQARAKVEHLLGRQVHMKLWVRVTPGWYETDSALRDFGYEPVKKKADER